MTTDAQSIIAMNPILIFSSLDAFRAGAGVPLATADGTVADDTGVGSVHRHLHRMP